MGKSMTREEIIKGLESVKKECGKHLDEGFAWICEPIDRAIAELEQEPVLDKIRAEIVKYKADCRLSVDEYLSCKQCTDNVFGSIYSILDKYKAEGEK